MQIWEMIYWVHDHCSNTASCPGTWNGDHIASPALGTHFHICITTKIKPFILQKVYQRTNYNIKWGGVQNSLNDKEWKKIIQ